MRLSRRRTLQTAWATALVLGPGSPVLAQPTPACGDGQPTRDDIEGPYFKANSPLRADLTEPGIGGERLTVMGRVLSRTCKPLKGVLLDFWQADANGEYDNEGFRLRGHQLTDDMGVYRLETILPGLYPGRARHIHVKAVLPSKLVLTTQLYFPREAMNARDRLFKPELVMMRDAAGKTCTFDFVLNA
jgi:protocatechuate 3,4-dioxygenase beta subunit